MIVIVDWGDNTEFGYQPRDEAVRNIRRFLTRMLVRIVEPMPFPNRVRENSVRLNIVCGTEADVEKIKNLCFGATVEENSTA